MASKRFQDQKKYSKFGLTIHPCYESDKDELNWKNMSKEEVSKTLTSLNFIKPFDLVSLINSMKLKAQNKKLADGQEKKYYSKVVDFGGQLELGSKNGIPHYQMWLEVKQSCRKTSLLRYFSEQIYGLEKSPQISVLILSSEISDYKKYCLKEDRANLPGDYSNSQIGKKSSEFINFLIKDPKAREALENPYTYQKFVNQLLVEPREERVIYWFVDLVGDAGKSLFSTLLTLDPGTKSMLIEVDYDRAFKMNLADDISTYIEENEEEPEAIILDVPRAEESRNLHETYSALEEILNGRVRGRFGNSRRRFNIRRNIKILVFANCPPEMNSMSHDRWNIFALFRSVDGKDVLIQKAKTKSVIVGRSRLLVTWRNLIETISLSDFADSMSSKRSDRVLLKSYVSNFLAMKELRKNDLAIKPGVIKKWGLERTSPIIKAPESIQALLIRET